MAQVMFDTQKFVETLEKEGFLPNQARAISTAVRQSHEVADVATKRDLNDVKRELKQEMDMCFAQTDAKIDSLRQDMENRFDKLTLQLTVRLGGLMLAMVGGIAALMKFF